MTAFSRRLWLALVGPALLVQGNGRAEDALLQIDFSRATGSIRPLHGLNQGPLAAGGLVDLKPEFKALQPPFIRLHDCHWPNADVVDIHVVFPDFDADPERPESYDFRRTDEYLAAIRATGADIVYRLGESIEHATQRLHVHPPRDPAKWAAICAGIVRHYNEGWANGHHFGIRYWEIWNEPENWPACWTGTDEEYFELYATTARTLKGRWPDLKIGGPAVGATGSLKDGRFEPTAFVRAFLERSRSESLPLDFFSWHLYTDAPVELSERARNIRALLDDYGFTKTESHLNEWNFLPGKTWAPTQKTSTAVARQQFYEAMSGPAGAAFVTAALIELQGAPVDMANFFRAEPGAFGIFNEYGVGQANYFAFQCFRHFLECPNRVAIDRDRTGSLWAISGVSKERDRARVLIAQTAVGESVIELRWPALPWSAASEIQIFTITAAGNVTSSSKLDTGAKSWRIALAGPGVVLVTLTSTPGKP